MAKTSSEFHELILYKCKPEIGIELLQYFFFNVDNSIETRLSKFCVLILDIIMEGTVSQILRLGPSSYFMW